MLKHITIAMAKKGKKTKTKKQQQQKNQYILVTNSNLGCSSASTGSPLVHPLTGDFAHIRSS